MPRERYGLARLALSTVIASEAKQSMLAAVRLDGLLRGACHRARIRATRWPAMTAVYDVAAPAKISAETGRKFAKSQPRPGAASSKARV
jgi:hypothetical protein